jgi:hypothetical protein
MKRKPGESFERYKKRRSKENAKQKTVSAGKVFWNSKAKGQYIKPKQEVMA